MGVAKIFYLKGQIRIKTFERREREDNRVSVDY